MDNTRIAGSLTIKDWKDLRDNLDSTSLDLWGNAFHFFEERIRTRYLNPIHSILNMDVNTGEGFAVVSLQCALIETIESFYRGWIFKYPKYYENDGSTKTTIKNQDIFVSFFGNIDPFNKSTMKAEGGDFFKNVRCGLLHETQTKGGWVIRKDKAEPIFYEQTGGNKIIYRSNFQRALEGVIANYKSALTTGNDEKLRENFIAKMNRICDVS